MEGAQGASTDETKRNETRRCNIPTKDPDVAVDDDLLSRAIGWKEGVVGR